LRRKGLFSIIISQFCGNICWSSRILTKKFQDLGYNFRSTDKSKPKIEFKIKRSSNLVFSRCFRWLVPRERYSSYQRLIDFLLGNFGRIARVNPRLRQNSRITALASLLFSKYQITQSTLSRTDHTIAHKNFDRKFCEKIGSILFRAALLPYSPLTVFSHFFVKVDPFVFPNEIAQIKETIQCFISIDWIVNNRWD
jgi:hypothetical protein